MPGVAKGISEAASTPSGQKAATGSLALPSHSVLDLNPESEARTLSSLESETPVSSSVQAAAAAAALLVGIPTTVGFPPTGLGP